MLVKIKKTLYFFYYKYLIITNNLIRNQRKDPLLIPIIIINYNQLFYLKQQVDFYIKRGFKNIIIIDNASTYKPLLEYYNEIKSKVTLEILNENYGHMVFFENKTIYQKYSNGYYIISDADVVPNNDLPKNFVKDMIELLDKYFMKITKVGFALKIDDIPDSFILKEKVINWEKIFWKDEIENDVFFAELDTTFSLYKPNYPEKFHHNSFYKALRLSGNFTAKHGGWYIDYKNPSEEQQFYLKTSSESATWKYDENGDMTNNQFNKIY